MFKKNYLKEIDIKLSRKDDPLYYLKWFEYGFLTLAQTYDRLPKTSAAEQKKIIQFIVLSKENFEELRSEFEKLSPDGKRLQIIPTIKAAQKIQFLHKAKSGIIKNIDFEAIAKNEIIKYQSQVDRLNEKIDNPPDEMDIQGLDRLYNIADENQQLAYEANALGGNCFEGLNNLTKRVLEILGGNESSTQGTAINEPDYKKIKKYTAKEYALAYYLECEAEDNRKYQTQTQGKTESDLYQYSNKNKSGNTIRKALDDIKTKGDRIFNIDFLIDIAGNGWRTKVIDISKEPEQVETFLKNKQL